MVNKSSVNLRSMADTYFIWNSEHVEIALYDRVDELQQIICVLCIPITLKNQKVNSMYGWKLNSITNDKTIWIGVVIC